MRLSAHHDELERSQTGCSSLPFQTSFHGVRAKNSASSALIGDSWNRSGGSPFRFGPMIIDIGSPGWLNCPVTVMIAFSRSASLLDTLSPSSRISSRKPSAPAYRSGQVRSTIGARWSSIVPVWSCVLLWETRNNRRESWYSRPTRRVRDSKGRRSAHRSDREIPPTFLSRLPRSHRTGRLLRTRTHRTCRGGGRRSCRSGTGAVSGQLRSASFRGLGP